MHLIHDPNTPPAPDISFDTLLAVDIRTGTILTAEPLPKARHPSYRLTIDFGSGIGLRKSVARITERYGAETLVGRQILAVVNLPPRQVGSAMSQVLVLGVPDESGAIILAAPDAVAPNGARLA